MPSRSLGSPPPESASHPRADRGGGLELCTRAPLGGPCRFRIDGDTARFFFSVVQSSTGVTADGAWAKVRPFLE